MWNAVILTVLISVAGFYSITDQRFLLEVENKKSRVYADDMANYRNAVMSYLAGATGPALVRRVRARGRRALARLASGLH